MKIHIKYMVSIRCKMAVKATLEALGLHYRSIDLGEVVLKQAADEHTLLLLKNALLKMGLELMDDKKSIIIEKLKNVVIEMIHFEEEHPRLKYSEYIKSKLDQNYIHLADLFSESTGITLEHYIIFHKIEKVKELLLYDELSLTEISYQLQYSSVAHLSAQFRKITGLTPTFFKRLKEKRRIPLQEL